jgi:hypothetical protein
MYMYGGPLENLKQLYLYGRVTRIYGISILKSEKQLAPTKVWFVGRVL